MSKETPEWMKFFFRAMTDPEHSYAGGATPKPIEGRPGFKGFRVEEGRYMLVDEYSMMEDGTVFGDTTMWEDGHIILFIQYNGQLDQDAEGAHRRVLRAAYQAKRFCWGRGRHGERIDGEDGKSSFLYEIQSDVVPTPTPTDDDKFFIIKGQEQMLRVTGERPGPAGHQHISCWVRHVKDLIPEKKKD